jgi:hypothetical protein
MASCQLNRGGLWDLNIRDIAKLNPLIISYRLHVSCSVILCTTEPAILLSRRPVGQAQGCFNQ